MGHDYYGIFFIAFYCGYGDTNIAIAKETHMNARKLYSLLGNHTEAGYPNARKNFFM